MRHGAQHGCLDLLQQLLNRHRWLQSRAQHHRIGEVTDNLLHAFLIAAHGRRANQKVVCRRGAGRQQLQRRLQKHKRCNAGLSTGCLDLLVLLLAGRDSMHTGFQFQHRWPGPVSGKTNLHGRTLQLTLPEALHGTTGVGVQKPLLPLHMITVAMVGRRQRKHLATHRALIECPDVLRNHQQGPQIRAHMMHGGDQHAATHTVAHNLHPQTGLQRQIERRIGFLLQPVIQRVCAPLAAIHDQQRYRKVAPYPLPRPHVGIIEGGSQHGMTDQQCVKRLPYRCFVQLTVQCAGERCVISRTVGCEPIQHPDGTLGGCQRKFVLHARLGLFIIGVLLQPVDDGLLVLLEQMHQRRRHQFLPGLEAQHSTFQPQGQPLLQIGLQ